MPVDDMQVWPRLHAEFFKNAVTHLSFVAQGIVMPFRLLMQCFVGHKIAFKGSHLVFIEGRGIRSAPHVPDIIQCKLFLVRTVLIKVSGAYQLVGLFQQLASPVFLLADADMFETAIRIQRHGSMIKQVTVAHQIHAAIRKQAAHVLLHLLAVHERRMNPVHQFALFVRQTIRVRRVYGGEIHIAQRIFLAFVYKHTTLEIHQMQQFPVLHTELRTAADDFRLQFQLDNRNRLVHLCNQPQGLLIVFRIGKVHFRRKDGARVIRIGIHGKRCKRQQIDAITILQRC